MNKQCIATVRCLASQLVNDPLIAILLVTPQEAIHLPFTDLQAFGNRCNCSISVLYPADNLQPLSFFRAHGQGLRHLLLALL